MDLPYIRELFLDTGVGVDAYSVIAQGARVRGLLESQSRRTACRQSSTKPRTLQVQARIGRRSASSNRRSELIRVRTRRRWKKACERSIFQSGRARSFKEYSQRLTVLRLMYALQDINHHAQVSDLDTARKTRRFVSTTRHRFVRRSQNELATLKREQHETLSANGIKWNTSWCNPAACNSAQHASNTPAINCNRWPSDRGLQRRSAAAQKD